MSGLRDVDLLDLVDWGLHWSRVERAEARDAPRAGASKSATAKRRRTREAAVG